MLHIYAASAISIITLVGRNQIVQLLEARAYGSRDKPSISRHIARHQFLLHRMGEGRRECAIVDNTVSCYTKAVAIEEITKLGVSFLLTRPLRLRLHGGRNVVAQT